ncbi:MAG: penicillin acylase family protein [Spirochaetes bacterium]|nr:penicillin acylase family protein [Spirochaetota bacterium]
MKPKSIVAAAALISLFLLGDCSYFQNKFARSVSATKGTVTVSGIQSRVTIRRDTMGVPVVEADNEDDLFFGAGYASAADRLWQMYAMTMIMQGRLAEVAGDEVLTIDVFMRTIGARERMRAEMARMDRKQIAILESYAKGVNAYLTKNPDLPAEFVLTGYRPEPWKPEDTLYVFAMLNMDVSANFIEELDYLIMASRLGYERAAMLLPVYPDEELPLEDAKALAGIPHAELLKKRVAASLLDLRRGMKGVAPMGFPASNNWALAGSRTKSGRSIICNDTHLALMIPNAWMMIHLKCPTYDAAGVTVPGVPVVSLGFNGKIAWGATMVMADSQDVFIEKLRKSNGKTQYLFKGEWLPVTERKEVFKIKGEDPVTLTIEETRHGPLFNRGLEKMPFPPELPVQPLPLSTEYGIAISSAMEGGANTLAGFYGLGKASTMAEARACVSLIESIYLNLVYGDRANIAWQVTGTFPVRKKGRGLLPSPGWSGEYGWTGFAKTSANPYRLNPPEGFLGTANNRTVPKNHPLRMTSSWYHPDRAERIAQLLGSMKNATMDDMIQMQHDAYSPMAMKTRDLLDGEGMRRGLISAASAMPAAKKALLERALDMLSPAKFDAVMDKDSAAAALMGSFWHAFTREAFLDELGPENGVAWEAFMDANMMSYPAPEDHLLVRRDSPFFDDITTPAKEGHADIVARSLVKAMETCADKMGSDQKNWKWGTIHTYHWKHDFTKKTRFFHDYFNRGPHPASGDVHSLNVTTYVWGQDFDTWCIPAMRMVVDFGRDEPAALVSVPGQSGNASTPHYADMIPYFLDGRNHPLPFREENIAKQYREMLVLEPGK